MLAAKYFAVEISMFSFNQFLQNILMLLLLHKEQAKEVERQYKIVAFSFKPKLVSNSF